MKSILLIITVSCVALATYATQQPADAQQILLPPPTSSATPIFPVPNDGRGVLNLPTTWDDLFGKPKITLQDPPSIPMEVEQFVVEDSMPDAPASYVSGHVDQLPVDPAPAPTAPEVPTSQPSTPSSSPPARNPYGTLLENNPTPPPAPTTPSPQVVEKVVVQTVTKYVYVPVPQVKIVEKPVIVTETKFIEVPKTLYVPVERVRVAIPPVHDPEPKPQDLADKPKPTNPDEDSRRAATAMLGSPGFVASLPYLILVAIVATAATKLRRRIFGAIMNRRRSVTQ